MKRRCGAAIARQPRVGGTIAAAKFFYDQDRKQTLESRVPALAHVVYHGKLGSQLQRVERISAIAVGIAKELGIDPTKTERAARLAKADLRTLMVGEFPELQGVMGEYYAQSDGEAPLVSAAIREHYYPRFAGDALPEGATAQCVALADKLETLVGLFGVGEKPTGEKDPFALRRHALGILRMLMENQAFRSIACWFADEASRHCCIQIAAKTCSSSSERLRGLLAKRHSAQSRSRDCFAAGGIDQVAQQISGRAGVHGFAEA